MATKKPRAAKFRRLERAEKTGDNAVMHKSEPSPELEAYFELCKRIYERMAREGSWPWATDSTENEDMIDSAGNIDDV